MRAKFSKLKGYVKDFLKARDRFWSGVWWTQWRLRRNEQLLAVALEQFGEDSMLVRQLTERHRILEKGVKYWRPSDPVVVRVLEASEKAGASRSDLRVLALNRDVYRVHDKIKVRRGWFFIMLAMMAVGVTFLIWLMLLAQIVSAPAGWTTRGSVALLETFFFWLVWPGLGLYTTRALEAVANVGEIVERIGAQQRVGSASVTSIDTHRKQSR